MSTQKKYFFFLIPALIATIPVLSQAEYASLKISSFSNQDKRLAVNTPSFASLLKPAGNQFRFSSAAFFTLLAGENSNADGEKINVSTLPVKNTVTITGNRTPKDKNDMNISFKPTSFTYPQNSRTDIGIAQFPEAKLLLYAKILKQYARKNGYDTSYAFFSNMGMLCNKKRFFVINLTTMEIEQAGLVSHGRGQGPSVFDKQYSNQAGSRCTSLGRYKILGKYKGAYGESYKIAGLDSSNKNALNRSIVLHSMTCIPDYEGIMPACVSDGCPAVSKNFLSALRKIIDSRKKPVLLWIFDSNLEEAVVEEQVKKNEPVQDDAVVNSYHHCSLHHPINSRVNELP